MQTLDEALAKLKKFSDRLEEELKKIRLCRISLQH